jgi:itaconate CoA-transferase
MLPLEGITVIAVEQAVAAPFCSSRLADAGAHVIKIERPEGDFARGYDAAAKGSTAARIPRSSTSPRKRAALNSKS